MKVRGPRFWNLVIIGALLITFAALAPQSAFAQLEWRVSVKFFLDPDGLRPSGNFGTKAAVDLRFERANQLLAEYGRGYQITWTIEDDIDEHADGFPMPDIWYCAGGDRDDEACYEWLPYCPNGECVHVDSLYNARLNSTVRQGIDLAAQADYDSGENRYHYRPDAINVYVLHTDEGGESVQPPSGTGLLLGQGGGETTPLHEIGHFMWLCHTFGCTGEASEGGCLLPYPDGDPNHPDLPLAGPVVDRIDDTLPDYEDWDDPNDPNQARNKIAWYSFCMKYTDLPDASRERVDDVYRNLMSYHPSSVNRVRCTPDQLDRMTDASNVYRYNVTNGLTHFVDAAAPGPGDGSSTAPYPTLIGGIAAAGQSGTTDIILLRAGSYNESVAINFPVYLRATRGAAVIGE